MKCIAHKPQVQSLGVKKDFFDITQIETFTISTELLKLCYLLMLFLSIVITLARTSPLAQVRANNSINR